jgi:hypothetical protein
MKGDGGEGPKGTDGASRTAAARTTFVPGILVGTNVVHNYICADWPVPV